MLEEEILKESSRLKSLLSYNSNLKDHMNAVETKIKALEEDKTILLKTHKNLTHILEK